MSDYDVQRSNMVDSQLRTYDVTDHRILQAMKDVPRETFVPASRRGIAYMDRDIMYDRDASGAERYIMSPMTSARLIQLADIGGKDIVLVIGCTSGYLAAVLANLADSVVCLESDARLAQAAAARLEELRCDNAATVVGSLAEGYSKEGPYDVIILNGSVQEIPPALFDQLKENGRLVGIFATGEGGGRAQIYRKIGNRVAESRATFDAYAHPLPGFARKQSFVF